MTRPAVLIVEDEHEIADLIRINCERSGFAARVVHSGRDALAAVDASAPDVISLDIMLPDLGGLEVCKALKKNPATADIPVVMVSALGEESEVVTGLELGADDYVTKPFSPRVLIARLRAVLRRQDHDQAPSADDTGVLRVGGELIEIDRERHEVRSGGARVDLTLTEFRLLEFLAQRQGFVRTRDQIVSAIRGEGTVLSSRAVDVHVAALRKKLGPGGPLIETVRGVGYRFSTDVPTEA